MNTNNDHRSYNGYSWITEEGKIFMTYCHECGRENYAMAVSSGKCAWCGYKDNSFANSTKNK